MRQDKRAVLNTIETLRERVRKLTGWQKVVSVEVNGLWNKDKIVMGLDYTGNLVNATFDEKRHITEAQSLLGKMSAAVDALEKEHYR